MAAIRIAAVEGAHLTATDRRNIKALFAHDGYAQNTAYVIGRKTYEIRPADDDRLEVLIVEAELDGYGRRTSRTYRSTFTATPR